MSQVGFTPIQLYYSTTASAAPSAGNLANGELALNITDGKLYYKDNGGVVQVLATKAGASGDVVGPASATDNALVRFDSTTGKLVQNSVGILDDSGNLTGLAAVTMSGALTLSGGTANGVPYLNGSKVLTTGSALTFDGSAFGVIGSGNPTFNLSGSAGGYTSIFNMNAAGGGASKINAVGGTNALILQTNTVDRATLDSSGNLGLGVTPSAWSYFKAMQVGVGSLVAPTNASNTVVYNNAYYNGTSELYITSNAASQYQQLDGKHLWKTAASGTAGNAISFTQAMTLDASGNLMLGTTTQQGRMHVSVNGVAARFTRTNNTDQFIEITGGDGAGVSSINANYVLALQTGGTERARIDSSGNLLVGQTGRAEQNSNSFDLDVVAKACYVNHASGTATTTPYYVCGYGGNNIGSITQNGTNGVLFNTSSDYRLKDITGPVTGAEAKDFVMALQPKQGTWKADGSRFVGFVAHEFQEVSPSSVSGEKDAVNEEGKPIMQSMQASSPEVMANLIALVQEQQAIIEQLKARLDAANL